jgi:hypothetical protein
MCFSLSALLREHQSDLVLYSAPEERKTFCSSRFQSHHEHHYNKAVFLLLEHKAYNAAGLVLATIPAKSSA